MTGRHAALFAVALAAMSAAAAAEAQSIPHISIELGSDVYVPGEIIYVSGLVAIPHEGAVAIRVLSPTGSVVAVGQAVPEGRDWSWSIPANFSDPGTYTILAHYALTADPEKRAAAMFVYSVPAIEGTVQVNGTGFVIHYTGGAIISAHTDPAGKLIHITFEDPAAAGVVRLPDGLYEGDLVVVSGGTITVLPDGSHAYAADSTEMVLAAGAVAAPEFGAAMAAAGAAAVAAAALPRLRRP